MSMARRKARKLSAKSQINLLRKALKKEGISPDAVKVVPRAKRGQVLYEWRDGRKYRIK
ncbi:MAG: hypothetical protein ACXQS1_02650 [Methermicoccaceae archaeon]